jgi:hypothetical protein
MPAMFRGIGYSGLKMDLWASLAISAVSGVGAAVVTVGLSLRQFQRQRLWERRLDACIAVVEALHHISNLLDAELRATGAGGSHLAGDRKTELETSYKEANANLSRLIDMGELLLSRKALRVLHRMHGKLDMASSSATMASDFFAASLEAVMACNKEFLRLARSDLNLSRGFLFGM